jgi:hypothetical protein
MEICPGSLYWAQDAAYPCVLNTQVSFIRIAMPFSFVPLGNRSSFVLHRGLHRFWNCLTKSLLFCNLHCSETELHVH